MPLFFLILFISTPAMAYIDPATGSIILSAIIGAFAATLFYIKNYFSKIKNFFVKIKKKTK